MFFDRAMQVQWNRKSPGANDCPGLRWATCDVIYTLPKIKLTTSPQILFVLGLTLIIGLQKTALFFARRQKLKGTAAFTSGILLILFRWPLIGFLVELYGIFVLFGDFFATIGSFAGNIPVVGPYIQQALNRAGGERRNADLPV